MIGQIINGLYRHAALLDRYQQLRIIIVFFCFSNLLVVMPVAGQQQSSITYPFGFQGMEREDEVNGDGNSYNTEFRSYSSRQGQWKSIDPLAHKFPGQSPYVGIDNNPIALTDEQGSETNYRIGHASTQADVDRISDLRREDLLALTGIETRREGNTEIVSDVDQALERYDAVLQEFARPDRLGGSPRELALATQNLRELVESLLPEGTDVMHNGERFQARELNITITRNTHGFLFGEARFRFRGDDWRQAFINIFPDDYTNHQFLPDDGAPVADPDFHRVMGPLFLSLHETEHNVRNIRSEMHAINRINIFRRAFGLPVRYNHTVLPNQLFYQFGVIGPDGRVRPTGRLRRDPRP